MKNFEEYFDVFLNPFTKEIKLNHHTRHGCYEKELSYNEIDEWQSFSTFKDTVFDMHVHYDQEMTVCIYPVESIDGVLVANYTESIKVNLTINLTEK